MNKIELAQLKPLIREIELLQKQLQHAEDKADAQTSDSVTGSSPVFPYNKHTIIITGVDMVKYRRHVRRIRRRLKHRCSELMDKKDEIEEFISTVPDSEMRMILQLRYVNGLPWCQIAASVGEYDESYLRRKHNTFLMNYKPAENVGK